MKECIVLEDGQLKLIEKVDPGLENNLGVLVTHKSFQTNSSSLNVPKEFQNYDKNGASSIIKTTGFSVSIKKNN